MALAIGAILALLAVMVAAYPFWRRYNSGDSVDEENSGAATESSAGPNTGLETLDPIYEAIRTLQLEREIGNIPEGLYREQMNLYRRQAALLLRHHEREQAKSPDGAVGLDWALEEEVKVARAALRLEPDSRQPGTDHSSLPGEGLALVPEWNDPMGDPAETSASGSSESAVERGS